MINIYIYTDTALPFLLGHVLKYYILNFKMILFLKRFYLFIFREKKGKEKERERNINVWLPLTCPILGTWPPTQACALTGN